jgi:hypothetical protein
VKTVIGGLLVALVFGETAVVLLAGLCYLIWEVF